MAKKFTVEGSIKGRNLPEKGELSDERKTVMVSVRLHESRKNELQRAFAEMGLDLSAGIRMVCYEWLRRR